MSIDKSKLVADMNEAVTTLGSSESINARSAAVAGQKFLNAIASVDPIEFNNEPTEPAPAEFTETVVEDPVVEEPVVEAAPEASVVEEVVATEEEVTQEEE